MKATFVKYRNHVYVCTWICSILYVCKVLASLDIVAISKESKFCRLQLQSPQRSSAFIELFQSFAESYTVFFTISNTINIPWIILDKNQKWFGNSDASSDKFHTVTHLKVLNSVQNIFVSKGMTALLGFTLQRWNGLFEDANIELRSIGWNLGCVNEG